MGLIHVYCGDGKGKTSVACGLAVRMAGRGNSVVIARFLKTDDSGEVEMLKLLPKVEVIPCEKEFGFVFAMDAETKREAAEFNTQLFRNAVEKQSIRAELVDQIIFVRRFQIQKEERREFGVCLC